MKFPPAVNRSKVGKYRGVFESGAGYVWDEVIEYRVWCHPERGAEDLNDGSDYFHAFATYEEAAKFSRKTKGSEKPLALILQKEFIDEPSPGDFRHVKEKRITEWPVAFLSRPKRTRRTIPDFLAQDAPTNRLAILRGTAKPRTSSPRRRRP